MFYKFINEDCYFIFINKKEYTFSQSLAKLTAMFMVPVDYPNSTPICSLELDWHGKHNRENSEIIRVFELKFN